MQVRFMPTSCDFLNTFFNKKVTEKCKVNNISLILWPFCWFCYERVREIWIYNKPPNNFKNNIVKKRKIVKEMTGFTFCQSLWSHIYSIPPLLTRFHIFLGFSLQFLGCQFFVSVLFYNVLLFQCCLPFTLPSVPLLFHVSLFYISCNTHSSPFQTQPAQDVFCLHMHICLFYSLSLTLQTLINILLQFPFLESSSHLSTCLILYHFLVSILVFSLPLECFYITL